MLKGVWFKKYNFWQNGCNENLDNFPLIWLCKYIDSAFMGGSTPTTAFDEWIQYFTYTMYRRHIEDTHEGIWCKKYNFWQNDSYENLDNFSLIRLLYMHWQCLHRPINSYHSFWWINPILYLHNVDILSICMKELVKSNILLQNNSNEKLDIFPICSNNFQVYYFLCI